MSARQRGNERRAERPTNFCESHGRPGTRSRKFASELQRAARAEPPAPRWTLAWFNGLVNKQNGYLDQAITEFLVIQMIGAVLGAGGIVASGLIAAVAGLLVTVAVGSSAAAMVILAERNAKEVERKKAVEARTHAEVQEGSALIAQCYVDHGAEVEYDTYGRSTVTVVTGEPVLATGAPLQ